MTDIIVAYGCELRDASIHKDLLAFLNAQATSAGTDKWTYPQTSPSHNIHLTYTKAGFAAALNKPHAVVIYDGHSRIGQGPVFGPSGLPRCPGKSAYAVNPWADNFRMGYDFAEIDCIGDIMHHGTNPTEFKLPSSSKGVFASKDMNKILERAIGAGTKCGTRNAWRLLSACVPKVAAQVNCRGETPLAKRHFWRSRAHDREFDTLVAVGDADLRKSKLACEVLFMNSCSSKRHFLAALRRQKAAAKSHCVFYVTAEVCSANTTLTFLKAVLAGTKVATSAKAILIKMNGMSGAGFISLEK
ncbi:hypothetical protein F2P45_19065 [Massilia sp. CCM 8733]|uniref:Uncharacterized protein n=1 Tax=Massilia mucilaginosa TaxID=2609282 RepID=A0ABX0NW64_9BURK|nr:hypothetical protein [Massilia mucilaginosa]NHZ91102.1 hypothetical protein [Massilia mucilaginosa]